MLCYLQTDEQSSKKGDRVCFMTYIDSKRTQLITVVAILQNGPHGACFLWVTLLCRLLSRGWSVGQMECGEDDSVGLPRLDSFSFILSEHFLWGYLVSVSWRHSSIIGEMRWQSYQWTAPACQTGEGTILEVDPLVPATLQITQPLARS